MGHMFPPIAKERFSLWTEEKSKYADWNKDAALPEAADYVIVGSGFAGASLAYHLSQETQGSVVVLEAREFCSGASGRNGGHLAPNYLPHHHLGEFERRNYDALFDLITQNGIDCWTTRDRHAVGWAVLDSPEQFARVQKELARHAAPPGVLRLWPAHEAQAQLGLASPIRGGALSIHSSPINPYRLVHWLLHAALQNPAVSLYTHAKVNHVINSAGRTSRGDDSRVAVETDRGTVRAKKLILATNAYTSFIGGLDGRVQGIVPTRGQLARFEVDEPSLPLNEDGRISVGWGDEYVAVVPYNGKYSYIVGGLRQSVPNGEQNIVDDSKINPHISKNLQSFALRVFNISSPPVQEWTGIMGFSPTPLVGPLSPNTYICAGFDGHGMSRIFLSAKATISHIFSNSYPHWFPKNYQTSSSKL